MASGPKSEYVGYAGQRSASDGCRSTFYCDCNETDRQENPKAILKTQAILYALPSGMLYLTLVQVGKQFSSETVDAGIEKDRKKAFVTIVRQNVDDDV